MARARSTASAWMRAWRAASSGGRRQDVEDAAFETAAVLLPAPTRTRFQLALMNLYQECPPLADMPRPERDGDWAETGDFCLDVWSWCPEPQRYIAPGSDEIEVYTPGGSLITAVETGYVAGWTVSKHLQELDNAETAYRIKWAADGEEYARARPWHGYLGVFGIREATSAGCVSYDVSESMRHVRAFIDGTDLWAGRGSNVPLPISFADNLNFATSGWVSVRWNRKSEAQHVWLAREFGGAVALYKSSHVDTTFGLVALLGTGSKPSLCVSRSGRVLQFWRDGSGNLKVQARNGLGGVTVATTTAVASVDDEGCACYEFTTVQGRKFALLYVSGGNLYRRESDDGIVWGSATLVEASGKKPAAFCDADGRIFECWVSGAKVRGRRLNALAGTVVAAADWVASGVDDAGIAVACSVGGTDEFRAVLMYVGSGAIVQKYSRDGSVWT